MTLPKVSAASDESNVTGHTGDIDFLKVHYVFDPYGTSNTSSDGRRQ